MTQYSNITGLGYVRSVTSNGPKNSTAYSNGPYFDDRVNTMFTTANTDW